MRTMSLSIAAAFMAAWVAFAVGQSLEGAAYTVRAVSVGLDCPDVRVSDNPRDPALKSCASVQRHTMGGN